MITDRPHGPETRYCRAASARCRNETNGMVIPVDDPCAFHCSPAETTDFDLDRRSDRPGSRTHLETLRYFNSVLCDGFSVDECRNFVHSAVVFRYYETRIETATGIDIEFAER